MSYLMSIVAFMKERHKVMVCLGRVGGILPFPSILGWAGVPAFCLVPIFIDLLCLFWLPITDARVCSGAFPHLGDAGIFYYHFWEGFILVLYLHVPVGMLSPEPQVFRAAWPRSYSNVGHFWNRNKTLICHPKSVSANWLFFSSPKKFPSK